MKFITLIVATLLTPAALAYPGMDGCLLLSRHKTQLQDLQARFAEMSVPKITEQGRGYTCNLVPAYGCLARTQKALPVTISPVTPAAPDPTVDFTEGFPMANVSAHLFYLHRKLRLTPDGTLMNEKTNVAGGYLRELNGRVYALLTEPFTRRLSYTDDPVVIHIGTTPERITGAYVCVPNQWFE